MTQEINLAGVPAGNNLVFMKQSPMETVRESVVMGLAVLSHAVGCELTRCSYVANNAIYVFHIATKA
jgi:hypothetical protein